MDYQVLTVYCVWGLLGLWRGSGALAGLGLGRRICLGHRRGSRGTTGAGSEPENRDLEPLCAEITAQTSQSVSKAPSDLQGKPKKQPQELVPH